MSDQCKAPNGRLREAGAVRIHELVESGRTYQEVAILLGISIGTVYNVNTGRTWAFVKADRDAKKASGTLPK
jgi:DNA invertase Pin-like site-specific DNA recombinase